MAITDWPAQERRVKNCWRRGQALSGAQLLYIFTHRCSGQERGGFARSAQRLWRLAGPINRRQALVCAPSRLRRCSAQLQTTLEMARRRAKTLKTSSALTSSALAKDFFAYLLRDQPHEVFVGLFLDNQHHALSKDLGQRHLECGCLSTRSGEASTKWNAAAVIFAHNHPSALPNRRLQIIN